MTAATKLYEVDVFCPKCGERPRLRMSARQLEKWQTEPPGELVQTYQCAYQVRRGKKCNCIYPITARALQLAHEM